MREKPSTVDIFLASNLKHRSNAESWAKDPGLSIDALFKQLAAIGYDGSRSAVGRWRIRFRKHVPGPMSDLRRQIVNAVLLAPDEVLQTVAEVLEIA